MRPQKFTSIVERLAARILNGDYKVQGVPSERSIADESGVSQMTARKAIKELLDRGLLTRLPNGRLEACASAKVEGEGEDSLPLKHLAFLSQAWSSPEIDEWSIAISRLAGLYGFALRPVHFFHNDDPALLNAVKRFDASFLVPDDPMPDAVVSELLDSGKPLFVLNSDWSSMGVPSINLFPAFFSRSLLDHLRSLGARRVDCLNVQPSKTIIPARIAQWRSWLEEKGLEGVLHNEPVEHYSEPLPAAYALVDRLIREGSFSCDALFCASDAAAQGAIRAMVDNGLRPGRDVAVCAAAGTTQCEYSVPSITAAEQPDPAPFLSRCLEWLKAGRPQWKGPLLMHPEDAKVAVRQSTVFDIDEKASPARRLSLSSGAAAS